MRVLGPWVELIEAIVIVFAAERERPRSDLAREEKETGRRTLDGADLERAGVSSGETNALEKFGGIVDEVRCGPLRLERAGGGQRESGKGRQQG